MMEMSDEEYDNDTGSEEVVQVNTTKRRRITITSTQ
jgi:hypothetical protein